MLYAVLHFLASILARRFFKLRVTGQENIPEYGGVIIASNHLSYLDIPLLACSIKRRVDFMGKKELFTIPIIGLLFRILGGFPLKRKKIDRGALQEAVKRLEAGRIVVIYPEGKRSLDGRLQPGKPGIGMIVMMSGKKVIPAAIQGTDKAMPVGKWIIRPFPVTVRFGPSLDFSDLLKTGRAKESIEMITGTVMENIAVLIDSPLLSSSNFYPS